MKESIKTYMNTFADVEKIFPTILFFCFISLNFLLNIEHEIKTYKISGYTRKSFNPIMLLFTIMSLCVISIFYFLDYEELSYFKFILPILIFIFFITPVVAILLDSFQNLIYEKIYKKSSSSKTMSITPIEYILIGITFFIINPSIGYYFKKNTIDFNTFEIYIYILLIIFILNAMVFKNIQISDVEKKFTFYKKDNTTTPPVQGYIISETKNHIIIENNGKLSKYNKSDIFSIEEI